MNRMIKCIFLMLLAVHIGREAGIAQTLGEDWLKSEFTMLLASYIEWPDEASIDTFRVGIIASEAIYTQLSLKARMMMFRDRPFTTRYFKGIRDYRPVHILYLDESRNSSLKRVFRKLEGKPVLLVTDSAGMRQYPYTMINLLQMNQGSTPFSLNKANLDRAGLEVSPTIISRGGQAEDIREIYEESVREKRQLQAELDSLNLRLVEKQQELQRSIEELDRRQSEIEALSREISLQKYELTNLSDSIDLRQLDLDAMIRLIGRQEARIRARERDVNDLSRDIALKEAEIAERSRTIEDQERKSREQLGMIRDQEDRIRLQKLQIERQQIIMYFFLILSLLIIAIGFVIYRAYQIKKRANRILEEKNRIIQEQNAAIRQQKEEIQSQRDQLKVVNAAIEKQNENITASIYYALTIQQAILPDMHDISQLFESFLIYLPKDIVSGDFYWYSNHGKDKSGYETIFLAVADCTGHGVPGGFLSMVGTRMLNAVINEQKVRSTDKILELMDQRLRLALNQQKTENDDGMDVCLIKVVRNANIEDEDEIYVSFSGARRALFLLRKGADEVEIIKGDRRTVGGKHFNPNPFTKKALSMGPGDRVYLTSDGLMDQHSPERQKFGTGKFTRVLSETSQRSLKEQCSILEEELVGFMRTEKQRDDITIMGIKL